jgi:hypothetical protein
MSIIQAFTIVDRRTTRPYTLHVRERPAVMSFQSQRNACYVALAIETREALGMQPSEPYTLLSLGDDIADEGPVHHFLQAYEDFETLLEDCKLKESDALFITEIETVADEPIQFTGELFHTAD